jgi:hypothetical protein
MKKSLTVAGTLLFVTWAVMLVVGNWSPKTFAQTASVDVVMMRCATGSDFGIKAYEGSPSAPAKRSGKCPETLSLLLHDGFKIESVGYFDQDDKFIAYTLIR